MRLSWISGWMMAALVAALPAMAQDAAEPAPVPQGGGVSIAAIVDDQAISTVDLNDRMALAMGTAGLPDTPETRARVLPQILRQLIDEKLQLEEAARDGITINDAKIKEGMARIEKQNGKAEGSLEAFLASRGLSRISMYAQVRAQMAWNEIVLKKIRPHVKVSDQEIARYIERKQIVATPAVETANATPGKSEEVLIAAIHMPVDAPGNENSVHKLADKLASEIRSGTSFEAVASQFSSSASGAKMTDPFWVDLAQVDPAIAAALAKISKGGVTDPVRTATGYQIIKLVDDHKPGTPTPPATPAATAAAAATGAAAAPVTDAAAPVVEEVHAELAFKQILMALKPDAKPKEAELLLTLAKEVQQSPGKCEDKSMAGAGDLTDMDFRITLTRALSSDLPEKLREFLLKLSVGQTSDPVVTPQGIRLFMLCERIDLPSEKLAPVQAEDQIRQSIYAEKLELEAQKYMRNLRREAFIEIRVH